MESDDDYESFSFHNNEPSPSPKHRRLKRLKKSTIVAIQSTKIESSSDVVEFPRVDFASLEALESSDIRAFDDSGEPLSSQSFDGFDGDEKQLMISGFGDTLETGDLKETKKRSVQMDEVFDAESFEGFEGDGDKKHLMISGFDDTLESEDRKETKKRSLQLDEVFDADDGVKVKELSSCFDDVRLNTDMEETKGDLEVEDGFNDDDIEEKSGYGDMNVRADRKKTKRALEFDDETNESGVDRRVENESETVNVEIRDDEEKDVNGDVMNEKKGKKKRSKISGEDTKCKTSSNKRKEAKERRAHLEQLHAESQRILRETRGVSFKPIPLVQKPISSILERIRQRKLEVSKKFSQSINNNLVRQDDVCVKKAVIDHSNSVDAEASDLSETLEEKKVSNVCNEEPEPDAAAVDGPDLCEEQKGLENACSQKALKEECTPAFRAPVDDTQELFGDSQTSDSKESIDDEPSEQTTSSQEEEMGPSLQTMKLKFDSAPDDISDEEENDKENVDPVIQKHSSPKGDPVKAFVDDEADEEDDSDNDRMRFGDEEEEDDDDDIEELGEMIATGYEERPIDLETRSELHQKWLEEKDAAGTDDLLRRLNVASKYKEEALLDEEGVEGNDDVDVDVDDDEDVERPRVTRIDSKKAKEMIAQMFNDKDEDFLSSDDEETEKLLVRERLLNKTEEKVKLVSPVDDEDSREVFRLIKKLNNVPESRKKAKTTSFFDTMLTGGNRNSSSKSSFLSRMSSHSVPTSTKQGGSSVVRSYIFGRDDSNSRSSISFSEDASDNTVSREIQTKKVTKYSSSQSQAKSSSQTAKLGAESSNSTSSFFEILKRSSVKSNVDNQDHKVELSQSVFAAFKIPKKPIRLQGRA